jgi:hypothetical protein
MPDDLTVDQANDLARYFLGLRWRADLVKVASGTVPVLMDFTAAGSAPVVLRGTSWREVFRSAGVKLPARSQYTAQGTSVMLDARAICTAVSNTMAKRITAALNVYTPGKRGI